MPMTRLARTLALLSAAVTAVPAQDAPAQRPTFRATADAVRLEVSVRVGTRVVTGLQARDFEVMDNGVAQEITEVSYGVLPIDVTVVLDVSASVTGQALSRLRSAIGELMGDLRKDDRLKLVLFNNRVTRIVDFTTDVAAVQRALRGASAAGGTSLYDAVSVALISAADPDRRQLVLVFTDGQDGNSATSADTLVAVARRSNATLSIVMPVSAGLAGALQTMTAVTSMAAETGGITLPLAPGGNMGTTFRSVLDEFRSTYVLLFTPRGVERNGDHTLQVRVHRERAIVRAKRGYVAGSGG